MVRSTVLPLLLLLSVNAQAGIIYLAIGTAEKNLQFPLPGMACDPERDSQPVSLIATSMTETVQGLSKAEPVSPAAIHDPPLFDAVVQEGQLNLTRQPPPQDPSRNRLFRPPRGSRGTV